MNPAQSLLPFSNLLEIANLSAPGGTEYEVQEKLVAVCRAEKRPFLLQMPVRHQFHCPICNSTQGEVEMHLEDPNQQLKAQTNSFLCPNPVGRFFDVERSVLHGILVHGNAMPEELQELLANVGG